MGKTKLHNPSSARGTKRIFVVITALVPVLFFLCLELALRWFSYGPNLTLFARQGIRGTMYDVMNPDVKFRYFGTTQFTPSTSVHYFLMPKPNSTYRIFCLGGSTTCGYPYYFNASFSSFLAQRLTAIFPQKTIEIINLGMTATNSFTALDIARELSQYQPDLIIDYDGHNEFYGALGVASNQTIGSSRFVTLLYLRMIHFRTYLLLRDLLQKVESLFGERNAAVSRGTMMETLARGHEIPYGSPLYHAGYRIFRENLIDLREYCRSVQIPLILGTQVSNLRDQPPLVSQNSAGSEQVRAQFQQAYRNGVELQSKGFPDSAIVWFRSSCKLDSTFADAHYRLGQCLDETGRKLEARSEYVYARDYDALRFRTDSKFNDLIRSMDDREHCFVADIEETFDSFSQDSIVGRNLILDHLHPNSRGYFFIAKTYAQVMRKCGMLAAQKEWHSADTVNEDELWKNRCVTDLDERMANECVAVIKSGWPFKEQSATIGFVPTTDTIDHIAQMLAIGKTGWLDSHMQAISHYQSSNGWQLMEQEYKTVIFMYPQLIEPYLNLASLFFRQKRFDDMKTILLRSLNVSPTFLAFSALGNITLDKGDPIGALKFFEKTDGFFQNPDERIQNSFRMGVAYSESGQYEKAEARLAELLRLKPDFQPAKLLLAEIRSRLDKNK